MILWKSNNELCAGTTLRHPHNKECNNMALHCGGNKESIVANRSRLAQELNTSIDRFVFAEQTHSDHIVKVTNADAGKGAWDIEDAIHDCDALYTKESNLLIGVFTADCVPILLHDPLEHVICAIHSGWMGTTKAITAKTLDVLIQKEGCHPKQMQAFIGPAISFQSFEVGLEVVEKMQALPFDTAPYIRMKSNGKAMVDNKGLNLRMLMNAGLLSENITVDKNDTFIANEAFFSYRRDKQCGRHLSFILQR